MDRMQDLRFALRQLVRSPGFALVAVLTLAFGIGANISIFSIVHGVVLQPLPYENGDELVLLRQHGPGGGSSGIGISVLEMEDFREGNRTLAGVAEYHSLWFTLLDRGTPERVQSGVVSWDFFQLLGVRPLHGRLFLPEENRQGAAPVLLLGHDFWQSHFGGDPGVVGRSVEMNDHVHTVVGILPPLPDYFGNNHVWMPWYACPFRTGDNWLQNRQWRSLTVLARLDRGVDLDGARADVAQVGHRMHLDHPETYGENPELRATLAPLRDELTREARPLFLLLLGMSGFVLLIACANVANLTLARLTRREHELSILAALGANRARLARQIVMESMLVAVAGGAVGLLMAVQLTDLFAAFAARFTPRGSEVGVGGGVLLFAVGASLAAGLLTGGLSALLFARRSEGSIREKSRHATAGAGAQRARAALVTSQVAVTFVLLVGAGLALRSFVNLDRVDPGFDPGGVLTMHVDLDWTTYTPVEARRGFYGELLERVESLPGVVSASVAGSIPLGGGVPRTPIRIEGRPAPDEGVAGEQVDFQIVSPGYFETLRIPLQLGRTFTHADREGAPEVVVINQSMARRHWEGGSPIGARISDDGENWATVVGVVGDVKQTGLESEFREQVYVPLDQSPPMNANLLLRTSGPPAAVASAATEAVHAVDSRQPVAFVRTMEEVRGESIASPRLTALLLGFFAALALVISVAGIAALVAFTVSQRIPELGVRVALGADRPGVLWMVMRQSVSLIGLGLALGAAGALVLARLIAGWLYAVPTTDPVTYGGVSLVLLAAALAAAVVPALRATRVDPMTALRAE